MNHKEFRQKMNDNGLRDYHLAKILQISPAAICGWKKKNKFPTYLEYYFENLKLKKQIEKLNSLIADKMIKKNNQKLLTKNK